MESKIDPLCVGLNSGMILQKPILLEGSDLLFS